MAAFVELHQVSSFALTLTDLQGQFAGDYQMSLVLSQFYNGLFRFLLVLTLRSVAHGNLVTSLSKHNSYSMQFKT